MSALPDMCALALGLWAFGCCMYISHVSGKAHCLYCNYLICCTFSRLIAFQLEYCYWIPFYASPLKESIFVRIVAATLTVLEITSDNQNISG